MRITRRLAEATDVVTVSRPGIEEHIISARTPGQDNLAVFRNFPPVKAPVVSQFVFGGCRFCDEAKSLMGKVTWPVTWVQGDDCSGEQLAGTQVLAVSGPSVRPIELGGRVVGCAYADEDAEWCHLGGLFPADKTLSRPEQARSVFERMEAALKLAGMEFTNVVRTWLFLDKLLSWYAEFNAVRTGFFEERNLFGKMIPASTGIGAGNCPGAALVAGAIAMKPKREGVRVLPVTSPLQCPATSYKSSFSRAVEVAITGGRRLHISGTASIDPSGQTAHGGDVDKQIGLTMKVLSALLESRGMTWADTTRVIAYFTDMRHAPRLAAYCREAGIPQLPLVLAHATICRHDLLFEAEVDAAKAEAKGD